MNNRIVLTAKVGFTNYGSLYYKEVRICQCCHKEYKQYNVYKNFCSYNCKCAYYKRMKLREQNDH